LDDPLIIILDTGKRGGNQQLNGEEREYGGKGKKKKEMNPRENFTSRLTKSNMKGEGKKKKGGRKEKRGRGGSHLCRI